MGHFKHCNKEEHANIEYPICCGAALFNKNETQQKADAAADTACKKEESSAQSCKMITKSLLSDKNTEPKVNKKFIMATANDKSFAISVPWLSNILGA